MMFVPPELSAADVLSAFHRDEPYLFLGAGFTTLGLLAAAFSFLRRKADPLLLFFAVFAIMYGQRLWINSRLLDMTIPQDSLFPRLRSGFDFLVAIPAVLFFFAAPGLLPSIGRIVGYVIISVSAVLAALTLAFGPSDRYHLINNVMLIAALGSLAIESMVRGASNPDLRVIRRGLLIFIAFVLWENINGITHWWVTNLEPIGFVAFLGSLGYASNEVDALADAYLPDVLEYRLSEPPGYPNGRRLTDDTADALLVLLTRGRLTSDLAGPHTDLLPDFPYLGPPHPPGEAATHTE